MVSYSDCSPVFASKQFLGNTQVIAQTSLLSRNGSAPHGMTRDFHLAEQQRRSSTLNPGMNRQDFLKRMSPALPLMSRAASLPQHSQLRRQFLPPPGTNPGSVDIALIAALMGRNPPSAMYPDSQNLAELMLRARVANPMPSNSHLWALQHALGTLGTNTLPAAAAQFMHGFSNGTGNALPAATSPFMHGFSNGTGNVLPSTTSPFLQGVSNMTNTGITSFPSSSAFLQGVSNGSSQLLPTTTAGIMEGLRAASYQRAESCGDFNSGAHMLDHAYSSNSGTVSPCSMQRGMSIGTPPAYDLIGSAYQSPDSLSGLLGGSGHDLTQVCSSQVLNSAVESHKHVVTPIGSACAFGSHLCLV
jgi:hypothetical protein